MIQILLLPIRIDSSSFNSFNWKFFSSSSSNWYSPLVAFLLLEMSCRIIVPSASRMLYALSLQFITEILENFSSSASYYLSWESSTSHILRPFQRRMRMQVAFLETANLAVLMGCLYWNTKRGSSERKVYIRIVLVEKQMLRMNYLSLLSLRALMGSWELKEFRTLPERVRCQIWVLLKQMNSSAYLHSNNFPQRVVITASCCRLNTLIWFQNSSATKFSSLGCQWILWTLDSIFFTLNIFKIEWVLVSISRMLFPSNTTRMYLELWEWMVTGLKEFPKYAGMIPVTSKFWISWLNFRKVILFYYFSLTERVSVEGQQQMSSGSHLNLSFRSYYRQFRYFPSVSGLQGQGLGITLMASMVLWIESAICLLCSYQIFYFNSITFSTILQWWGRIREKGTLQSWKSS